MMMTLTLPEESVRDIIDVIGNLPTRTNAIHLYNDLINQHDMQKEMASEDNSNGPEEMVITSEPDQE